MKIGDLVFVRGRRGVIASEGFTKIIVDYEDQLANARGLDCATFATAYRVLFPETGSTEVHVTSSIRPA